MCALLGIGLVVTSTIGAGCGFGEDPDVVIFDHSDDGGDSDLDETDAGSSSQCSFGAEPVVLSRLPLSIAEASGMATSVTHPGVFWMNNDSGDSATVYAVDWGSGEELGRVTLSDIAAVDWEDISVSACASESDEACIYIADFGDNLSRRESVVFYRLREPEALEVDGQTSGFDAMVATYPDGAANAEAMVIEDGVVWVFTKRRGGFEVYSHPFEAGATVVLEKAGVVEFVDGFDSTGYTYDTATAADWSTQHRSLVMRTYGRIYVFGWNSVADASVLDALGDPSFVLQPGAEFQGESIAWVEDGIAHVAEGRQTPIWLLPCK